MKRTNTNDKLQEEKDKAKEILNETSLQLLKVSIKMIENKIESVEVDIKLSFFEQKRKHLTCEEKQLLRNQGKMVTAFTDVNLQKKNQI